MDREAPEVKEGIIPLNTRESLDSIAHSLKRIADALEAQDPTRITAAMTSDEKIEALVEAETDG